MDQKRIKKLESVCQELVSQFIFEEMRDTEENFGMINITGVKISPDISYLDIFVSCLKNEEILPKTLAKHNHDIQRKLNKKIDIRKLPRIRFRYDKSGETGQTIGEIIKKECTI